MFGILVLDPYLDSSQCLPSIPLLNPGTKTVKYKSASFQKVFLMPVLPIANCYQIANHLMWTTPSCPDSSSPLLASAKGSKAFRLSN